jgi:Dolichyl-phosphate-mannose-protein mannosyltransferase
VTNPRKESAVNRLLLWSCLVAATVSRLSFAGREQLLVPEAESSINALTILERGYPGDRYLGLPIYENVLVTTSPDSPEYEFRDAIHSDRGMAIDHGWLPLYAIAAAYALAGIHPDADDRPAPVVRHASRDLTPRTIVPRLPSIAFAVLFLWSVYVLARTISGGDTAWSVLLAAAFAQPLVLFGWEARFDSATLALSGLSGLAIWNLTRRAAWRDSLAAGFALMLLFHTHVLSFVILTAVLLCNVPFARGRPRWTSKLLLTAVVAASGIVPWLYWTRFFHAAARVPMAWPLLTFPADFIAWFAARKAFVGVIGLVLALALVSMAFPRRRLARRIISAARDSHAFYFTLTWFVVAYVAFILMTPAAGFVNASLMLVLAVPGYLLFALCVAVAARTMTARFAAGIAPLLVLMFLGLRGSATFVDSHPSEANGVKTFLDVASSWTLEPGTKIYAWPNENLLLTYLSGLPIQSIAPVRKAFLDEFPGDVIFVETGTAYAERPLTDVQSVASRHGVALSVEAARRAALRIQRLGARRYLQGLVTNIWPPPEPAEPIDSALLATYAEQTHRAGRASSEEYRLLRGFAPTSRLTSHWLPVSYWFVNPEHRLGDQLNYRDRIRRATGIVLPNGSIVFDGRRKRDVPLVDRDRYVVIERGMSAAGS